LRFLNIRGFPHEFGRFAGKKLRMRDASFMMCFLDCIGRSRTNVMAQAAAW
jgi:hypothetical protein